MLRLVFIILVGIKIAFSGIDIRVEGYGETPEEARKDALRQISELVVSEIASEVKLRHALRGEKLDKRMRVSISLKTKGYIRGVKFGEPERINGKYRVKAVWDEESMEATIKSIYMELSVDIDKLTKEDLREILRKIDFLIALYTLMPLKDIDIEKVISMKDEVLKRLNFSAVIFYTEPEDATVKINGVIYEPYKPIYLPERMYIFTVSKEGYYPVKGRFYAMKGMTKVINIRLVPESETIQKYRLIIEDSPVDVRDIIENTLRNFGVDISPDAEDKIVISFKHSKDEFGEYIRHSIKIHARVYKGRRVVADTIGETGYFFTLRKDMWEPIRKKLKKVINEVLRDLFIKVRKRDEYVYSSSIFLVT